MNELLERLITVWAGLAPRERILVGVALGLLGVAVLYFGVIGPIASSLGDSGDGAADQQRLALMQRLRDQYDEVDSRLAAVEERIRANPQGGRLRSMLDSLARDSAVEVESMDERPAQDSEVFKETRVDIKLARVTLEQAIKYLHSIQSSKAMLSIKSLRMKNRADKSKLLDVSFSVSSFDPL